MAQIRQGRFAVDNDEPVVVFVIGARIHKWWAIHRWLPVARAMQRMIRELEAKPESGYLGGMGGAAFQVQYWRSADHLLAYASDRDGTHFPAWADYHKRIRKSGAVGVWHETYLVAAGAYEAMYVDMPATGIGAVRRVVPATGAKSRARGRLGGDVASAA